MLMQRFSERSEVQWLSRLRSSSLLHHDWRSEEWRRPRRLVLFLRQLRYLWSSHCNWRILAKFCSLCLKCCLRAGSTGRCWYASRAVHADNWLRRCRFPEWLFKIGLKHERAERICIHSNRTEYKWYLFHAGDSRTVFVNAWCDEQLQLRCRHKDAGVDVLILQLRNVNWTDRLLRRYLSSDKESDSFNNRTVHRLNRFWFRS